MDEDLTYLPEYLQPIVQAFLDLVDRYMVMLRDKKVTVTRWKSLMQEAIAEHHAAAFMAGLQSTNITLPMQRMIEDAVAFQLPFLDNFARVIAALPLATITLPDGRSIENAIPITPALEQRARLYTLATVTTAEEGNVIRQVGHSLPLPAMPGQGTQCLTRCGCTWVIKTLDAKNEDYNAYWTLDPRKVHCQTCTQRDIEWNGEGRSPVRIRGGVLLLDDEVDPLEGEGVTTKHLSGKHNQRNHGNRKGKLAIGSDKHNATMFSQANPRKQRYERAKAKAGKIKQEINEIKSRGSLNVNDVYNLVSDVSMAKFILEDNIEAGASTEIVDKLRDNLDGAVSKRNEVIDPLRPYGALDNDAQSITRAFDKYQREKLEALNNELGQLNEDLKYEAVLRRENILAIHEKYKPQLDKMEEELAVLDSQMATASDTEYSKLLKQKQDLQFSYAPLRNRMENEYRKEIDVDNSSTINAGSAMDNMYIYSGVRSFQKLVDASVITSRNDIDFSVNNEPMRSYFHKDARDIRLGSKMTDSTVVHEMGHWLETTYPDIAQKARGFLSKRTQGETLMELKGLYPNAGYGENEVVKVDKFLHPYMGKVYPGGDTEIMSMGLQMFHENPAKFATEDPEYFDFIYNTVRGR